MQMVNAEDISRVMEYPGLVAALREAHLQDILIEPEILLSRPLDGERQNNFNVFPAWQDGVVFGAKLVSLFPENLHKAERLPMVQGVYVLFDGKNGSPVAVIDGTALTYWKAAADSALGASLLARNDIQSMVMVGAGALSPHVISAHLAIRPSLSKIRIFDIDTQRAEALVQQFNSLNMDIAVSDTLERDVGNADLVSCATTARKPVICGGWLKPGTHVDLIGGWTPEMREVDDEAIRHASLYVDSILLGKRCGDISNPLSRGIISESDILGDLFDLCRGSVSVRQNENKTTIFKNAGGGHLDLIVARYLLAKINLPDIV